MTIERPMDSCCFASVIFEGNLPYFPEFLASLQQQTDTDFTLLLFNDGVAQLSGYLANYQLPFEIIETSGSIAQVREQMLNYLTTAPFSMVVFGDTDDFFAQNRIALSKKELAFEQILVHDVWLVDEDGKELSRKHWSDRIDPSMRIDYDMLRNYNLLGLGNTAIQTNILPKDWQLPSNLIAVDWFVFASLLKTGIQARFSPETHVYYRQYEGNTIGLKQLTLQRFKREIAVKAQHYEAMAQIDASYSAAAIRYREQLETVEELKIDNIQGYIKEQNHPFWWEQVQL